MNHSHSQPPEASDLATKVASNRRSAIEDLLVTLRACYDPEVRSEFKVVIQGATGYGILPKDLADAFAVSTATISRWGNGSVVPSKFVRQLALDRIEKILTDNSISTA